MRLLTLAMTAVLATTAARSEPRMDAIRDTLPEQARKTLDAIPNADRGLLALRSYLRSARSLQARWSWDKAQIDAYLKSDQYVSAMAAVAAVTKAFEVKNPGYTLLVNTEIRSLEEQIDKWNGNASVQAAANGFDAAVTKWLADNAKAGSTELADFIRAWKPAGTAMLAAPGLTLHGRGEAIDFQVTKDGAIIAGADSGSVRSKWEAEGWSRKLQDAVKLSHMPFEGPLRDPDEPWHYDYNPPERSELVTAEADPSTPEAEKAAAEPPAKAPETRDEKPAPDMEEAPPVIGSVPVPVPTARPETPVANETEKASSQKIEPAPRKKASTKQAKKPKKRVSKTSAAKSKRWPLPF